MIDNPDLIGDGSLLAGGGLVALLAKWAWERFFSAPVAASDALYSQIKEQLDAQAARIERLEKEVDDERVLRRTAQLEAATYRLTLVQHGIAVPEVG